MVAQLFNLDAERVFGGIQHEYAMEVYQEMYDAKVLEERMAALRAAQRTLAERKKERGDMMRRLERMGEVKIGTFGSAYDKPPTKTLPR